MQTIDEAKLESDLAYRFGYLTEFIGLDADDIEAIHASAAHLAPLVPALVDAVYVKLFNYDATKRHFVPRQSGYCGQPQNWDPELEPRLAVRKTIAVPHWGHSGCAG